MASLGWPLEWGRTELLPLTDTRAVVIVQTCEKVGGYAQAYDLWFIAPSPDVRWRLDTSTVSQLAVR